MMEIKFSEFMEHGVPQSIDANLYIIWDNKQALYVGISIGNVWTRWFGGYGSHMTYFTNGLLTAESWIGNIILNNKPKSMDWDIELLSLDDYKNKEEHYIKLYRPLFNRMLRDNYTTKENKLINYYEKQNLYAGVA